MPYRAQIDQLRNEILNDKQSKRGQERDLRVYDLNIKHAQRKMGKIEKQIDQIENARAGGLLVKLASYIFQTGKLKKLEWNLEALEARVDSIEVCKEHAQHNIDVLEDRIQDKTDRLDNLRTLQRRYELQNGGAQNAQPQQNNNQPQQNNNNQPQQNNNNQPQQNNNNQPQQNNNQPQQNNNNQPQQPQGPTPEQLQKEAELKAKEEALKQKETELKTQEEKARKEAEQRAKAEKESAERVAKEKEAKAVAEQASAQKAQAEASRRARERAQAEARRQIEEERERTRREFARLQKKLENANKQIENLQNEKATTKKEETEKVVKPKEAEAKEEQKKKEAEQGKEQPKADEPKKTRPVDLLKPKAKQKSSWDEEIAKRAGHLKHVAYQTAEATGADKDDIADKKAKKVADAKEKKAEQGVAPPAGDKQRNESPATKSAKEADGKTNKRESGPIFEATDGKLDFSKPENVEKLKKIGRENTGALNKFAREFERALQADPTAIKTVPMNIVEQLSNMPGEKKGKNYLGRIEKAIVKPAAITQDKEAKKRGEKGGNHTEVDRWFKETEKLLNQQRHANARANQGQATADGLHHTM